MLNILIVDDDPDDFRLIDRMIKKQFGKDYMSRYAENLEKAEDFLKTQKTDIVLLDNRLSFEVTVQKSAPALKAISPSVPIILMSDDLRASYLQDKTIMGVYDIVDKIHLPTRIANGLLVMSDIN